MRTCPNRVTRRHRPTAHGASRWFAVLFAVVVAFALSANDSPTLPRTALGAVSGNVRGEPPPPMGSRGVAGVPLSGVVVKVFSSSGTTAEALTDASGNFVIEGLTPGTYTVGVGPTPEYDQQFYNLQCAGGTPVTVAAGITTNGIDFFLLLAGTTLFCDGFESGNTSLWSTTNS